MQKPKLIYGEDNGYCSLWDIDLAQYDNYRERIDNLYERGKDEEAEKLENELKSHQIEVGFADEHGYVPDYAGYMAKVFKIDVDSN